MAIVSQCYILYGYNEGNKEKHNCIHLKASWHFIKKTFGQLTFFHTFNNVFLIQLGIKLILHIKIHVQTIRLI